MSKRVMMIDSTATLLEAAELMRDNDLGALPVADANRPIGMVTDRDIVVRALADYKDPGQTRVREIITPRLTTIFEDQDCAEAADLMAEQQVRRLLVVDHRQNPVGVLSMGDLGRTVGTSAAGRVAEGVSQPTSERSMRR